VHTREDALVRVAHEGKREEAALAELYALALGNRGHGHKRCALVRKLKRGKCVCMGGGGADNCMTLTLPSLKIHIENQEKKNKKATCNQERKRKR
jgi:hypothetical protein